MIFCHPDFLGDRLESYIFFTIESLGFIGNAPNFKLNFFWCIFVLGVLFFQIYENCHQMVKNKILDICVDP